MTKFKWPGVSCNRRSFIRGLAASGLAFATPARAATREEIIEAASREAGLIWYDHYDRDATDEVLAAFRKTYPFVKKTEFVSVPSAQKTARIIQESTAGGPTTDILLNDASIVKLLRDRGFVLDTEAAALGVTPALAPTPYLVSALTPPYVILYNTNLAKDDEVPRTWEDAVDAKWKGRTGHWMRAAAFVNLSSMVGDAKARELLEKLAALKPRLFEGLFPLSQAVGSGEIAMAITAYDSAIRIVEKGAPVKIASMEPTAMGMISGAVMKFGKSPNTARLFIAWLASTEGAITFESATKRGNAFVPGTETAKLLAGRKLAYHTAEQSIANSKQNNALEVEFSRKLAGR